MIEKLTREHYKSPHKPWPKLTPPQRALIIEIAQTQYGEMYINGGRYRRSVWRLQHEGMLNYGPGNWYQITSRGRDYVNSRKEKKC